jgi:hypothetical protein
MVKTRPPKKAPRVPRSRRVDVTREEFDRIAALLADTAAAVGSLRHDLEIQFTRMAQIQNELETVQRRVQKVGAPPKR